MTRYNEMTEQTLARRIAHITEIQAGAVDGLCGDAGPWPP
jgi:hypothetical protein